MVEQHEKTLVPQIRFAGFTDPWEQRKLGEVANVCSGRDYKHLAEGPIPVYGTGGYMTSVSKALSYDEDAIGIGRKGTIDKPYRLQAPFWTVDTLFYAIPEASSDINFLLCSFLNVDWKSKDESTGLPSLSKRAINETEVLVPDNGEQRRIGAFFDRLDSLITLHQRKYDKLCVLKKSMLDKMFPKGGSLYPEIRFAGFTDPWEQRKLGELYKEVSEKNDLTYGKDRIISVAHMYFNPVVYVTEDDYLKTYNVMRLGDIAFEGNRSKNFAHGRLVENTIGDGIVSHVFKVFRPIQPFDLMYWKYSINNEKAMKDVLTRSTKASTMMHELVAKDFLNEEIAVPSLEEQRQIGGFFDRLDSLITLHQRK
uniref:restriction endonuclease subunit S n=1 Tax=Bifidobacterium pseudocatenulatum TaxID=28026 RepID=UPI0022E100DA